jgi:chorismate dehydratase
MIWRPAKLDVALIPSIRVLSRASRGISIVSDAAIACRGPVWSVRLLSRVPISQIKTLALDVGSRTSAALVQMLLRRHGIVDRDDSAGNGAGCPSGRCGCDVDDRRPAMHPPAGVYHEIIDLGQWWNRLTGIAVRLRDVGRTAGIDS